VKNLKKIALIVALVLVFGVANANAFPVTFNIDELYDWGRLYNFVRLGSNHPTVIPPNSWHPVNPNPFDSSPGSIIPADTTGNADTQEDSWGIGTTASITDAANTSNVVWSRTPSQELTLFFWGFDDDYIDFPNTTTGIASLGATGGHIQVYLDNVTPDFSGSLGTAGRTAVSTYTGVTDGTLVLDLVPVAQNAAGHTLISSTNITNGDGGGNMYLDVIGGAWADYYDTNTQDYGSDLSLGFTVENNLGSTSPVANWVVKGDARGEADLVPEPASMLLLGIGLAGFGITRRKKKSA
jgi:hypothetical protein